MAVSLGLSIGESFADFAASPDLGLSPQRFYLGRRTLTDALKEYLGTHVETGGQILVATTLATFAVGRRLGSAPAFLVTSGFENWLKLQQPLRTDNPQVFPIRQPMIVADDHIFGLSERLRADGSVDAALSDEDLEFLAAKLELLKTRTIAVGLLHSGQNSAHEKKVKTYFEEKGFRVFCSHEVSNHLGSEIERWSHAVKAASVWSALNEQKQQLEAALGELKEKWTIRYVTRPASAEVLRDDPGIESENGAATALLREHDSATILHLDIEQFSWLQPGRIRLLKVQPTTPLQQTMWPFAVYADSPLGFEPGPMAFGKSLQPTAFDVFFVRERLEQMDGISALLSEKTKQRILETLFTLSKEMPSKTRVDAQTVAADLETALLDRMNEEILLSGIDGGEIVLTGALARSLHPRLEARRPDLKFRLAKDSEFATAIATLRIASRA